MGENKLSIERMTLKCQLDVYSIPVENVFNFASLYLFFAGHTPIF